MNPKLVTWDYGKDINVTLEDAVISWEEMRILMGAYMKKADAAGSVKIHKNAQVAVTVATEGGEVTVPVGDGKTNKGINSLPAEIAGFEDATKVRFVDIKNGVRGTAAFSAGAAAEGGAPATFKVVFTANGQTNYKPVNGQNVRFFWTETAQEASGATELVITPNDFPGSYRVVGDALIRSEDDMADEAFQFVINKAKLLSEVTITLQAEGEPSTFSMTLNVLRDNDGNMMKLLKY